MEKLSAEDQALIALGRQLKSDGYHFITVTPETHARILKRADFQIGTSLEHIFGWNIPFHAESLPSNILDLLAKANALRMENGLEKSAVRFSTLGELIFLHSTFPTIEPDAVFFGPDTYRFAHALDEVLKSQPEWRPQSILDIGSGTGAGGLHVAHTMSSIKHILLSDISSKALRFSRINAALNGFDAETRLSDVLLSIPEKLDLIVSNPPYLADRGKRMYRDGGGTWGIDLSVRIVKESLSHLTAEGKFVLYTGTPIVAGIDQFKQALIASLGTKLRCFRYEEIDPDVFGEELAHSPYDQADRIAAVFLVIEASDIDV